MTARLLPREIVFRVSQQLGQVLCPINLCEFPEPCATTMADAQSISQLVELKRIHGVAFSDEEIYWRDHQKWLLECGYRLRPRYQPDWTPSWKKSGKPSILCEDSFGLVVRRIT